MRLKKLALIAGAALLSGCYHITVTSNAAPSPTVVDKPWQHSFIAGLVPPPEINVKEQCPNGVSKVETRHSPANVLATILVQGLYSPISARITCAAP
jgi:hypothetical protein